MGADASPEAGRKVAGRLAGRTEGEAGRNEACRVVSCRARQPAPQVAVSGVWTRPKRRAGTRTRTRTRIQQKMYYWQEQSEADARAPDTMGAPVPPTQQPVAGRAQSGWSLPCRLPAESKRSAPARLPAPARGCPALPLVPALLLASECSRRLRGRHATLIITTPLSGGRPATARHPAPATWFCWRPSRCAAGSGRGMPLRAGWGSGPRSIRTGSPAWPRPPSWADVQRPLLFKVPRASHRSCRVVAIAFGVSSATPAKPVLCCCLVLYIYTRTHNESSRAILARRVAPCQTARPTPPHQSSSPTAGGGRGGGNSRIGIFEVFGGRNTSQNSKQARH